ncbi:WD40 repeat domain-containing protein [Actinoplanes rectilineatus]|uniref:WD40 repeat domain-containing protein n=1 Tax=Actinoplanes rectilineatus TaxID=113571 RepID=UPI0012F7D0B3|nr:WD40 repeat domain-containing protein [Actinoplanes rectilineatus]
MTLSADGVVKRWNLVTGELLSILDSPGTLAICGGLLSSGRRVVVTAGRDLFPWDAQVGERLPLSIEGKGNLGAVAGVVLANVDGRDVLAVVTGSREIVMYDVNSGARTGCRIDAHVDDFSEYRGRVWGGRCGRPKPAMVGGMLAVPTRWRIHLWDFMRGEPAGPPLSGPVHKAVLASLRYDGQDWLVTGSAEDGMLGLWNPKVPDRQLAGNEAKVVLLDATVPGVVVCADDGGTLMVRRSESGVLAGQVTHTGIPGFKSLVVWEDEQNVMAGTGAGSTKASHRWLQRWNLTSGTEMTPSIELSVPQIKDLAIAVVRGERVLVTADRGLLQVWRAIDGALLDEVRKYGGTFRLLTRVVDGDPVAVISAVGRPPEIFRLDDLKVPPESIDRLDGYFVEAMDGDHFLVGNFADRAGGRRTMWASGLTGEPVGPDLIGPPVVSLAIVSWPAAYIARDDGTVSLVDVESGDQLCSPLQLPESPSSIAVTEDGDLLAAVGNNVIRTRPPHGWPERAH